MSLLRRIHREEEVNKILGSKKSTLLSLLFKNINNVYFNAIFGFLWLNLSPRIRQAYSQFASAETLPQIPSAVTLPFFMASAEMIIGLRTQLLPKANAGKSRWTLMLYLSLLYSFGLAQPPLS